MNRLFRVVVGAVICAAACTPNQSVKPGAPELIEYVIVQGGPKATVVTPDTPECTTALATGDACHPSGLMADVADGGTNDANLPADSLCRLATAMHWCTCNADMMDPNTGTWDCDPFSNVLAVVAVFDRLLDTAPLDPGDKPGRDDLMTATANAAPLPMVTHYSATGDKNGLIFNKTYGPMYFGNFWADGPSLFGAPDPAFPSSATVTITLTADNVRAKDGHTLFTGTGTLLGGNLIFSTAPFTAVLLPPDPKAGDTNAVILAFTNVTDPTGHITVTVNGVAFTPDVNPLDGSTYAIEPPMGAAWPTGATVVVTLDGTTKNLADQMIPAPVTQTFTAP